MACKGLIHPVTRERATFDEVARDRSWHGGRAAFVPWVAGIMGDSMTDEGGRYKGVELSTTRTLTCPRETFISTLLDWWADPEKRYPLTRGSGLHRVAGEFWPATYVTERQDPALLEVKGVLFEQLIVSHIDVLGLDGDVPRIDGAIVPDPARKVVEIIDMKFPSDWSVSWRAKKQGRAIDPSTGGPDDNAIQLNIARLVLGQVVARGQFPFQFDPDDVLMTVWDHASGKIEGPAGLIVPVVDETTMRGHRPGGGAATVAEITEEHGRAMALGVEAGVLGVDGAVVESSTVEQREALCSSLRLVGQEGMYGGRKCTEYCPVERECSRLVREYGVPGCAT